MGMVERHNTKIHTFESVAKTKYEHADGRGTGWDRRAASGGHGMKEMGDQYRPEEGVVSMGLAGRHGGSASVRFQCRACGSALKTAKLARGS